MRALSFRPNGENGRFRAEDGRGGKRLRGKKAGLTRRHGGKAEEFYATTLPSQREGRAMESRGQGRSQTESGNEGGRKNARNEISRVTGGVPK